MDVLARCFLLVFFELYAGGMLAIAIPPFHDIERGFYNAGSGAVRKYDFPEFCGLDFL